MIKSPFYVVQDFISPLLCEDIIEMCNFNVPDQDREGHDVLTFRTSERAEQVLYERLQLLVPELQAYYNILYKGTERISFEWFPQGSAGAPRAENSDHIQGKWMRTKQRDLSAILFLTDYQDKTPFEQDYEILGGKLEFPQHKFGFNPQRGTLIVFPSDPHFINLTSKVLVGDAFQARFQIAAQAPYLYDPQQFKGNYLSWFSPPTNS